MASVMAIFYKEKTGWWYGPRDLETIDDMQGYDYILPLVFPLENGEWVAIITDILETAQIKPPKTQHSWVNVHSPERNIQNGFLIYDNIPKRPFNSVTDSIERLKEVLLDTR